MFNKDALKILVLLEALLIASRSSTQLGHQTVRDIQVMLANPTEVLGEQEAHTSTLSQSQALMFWLQRIY